MDTATNEPGIPVEIGNIDKELGKLWESADDSKTRASHINLVIYSEDPDSLETNTRIIASIAGKHACRAILILADPQASEPGARAWINAHCQFTGKDQKQICSEQITFRLDGESTDALPNIVFSHLDSDLPLCLWWQAPFHEPLDPELWTWVDRLIFDSATWTAPSNQFPLLDRISSTAGSRIVLCDLSWTRLHSWRVAIANLFDHQGGLSILNIINSVVITAPASARASAYLLAGWISSQLGWTLDIERRRFIAKDRRTIDFEIKPTEAEGISRVELCCSEACFHLDRGDGHFHATLRGPGVPNSAFTLPAAQENSTDTLLGELNRGGRHPLYARSRQAILPLILNP